MANHQQVMATMVTMVIKDNLADMATKLDISMYNTTFLLDKSAANNASILQEINDKSAANYASIFWTFNTDLETNMVTKDDWANMATKVDNMMSMENTVSLLDKSTENYASILQEFTDKCATNTVYMWKKVMEPNHLPYPQCKLNPPLLNALTS